MDCNQNLPATTNHIDDLVSSTEFQELPKAEKWAILYLHGLDIVEAGVHAGYTKESARTSQYTMLRNPNSELSKAIQRYADAGLDSARTTAKITSFKTSNLRDRLANALSNLSDKELLERLPRCAKALQGAEEIAGLRVPEHNGPQIVTINAAQIISQVFNAAPKQDDSQPVDVTPRK